MPGQRNNSNQCEYCGERFVVVSLARCCEMKHEGVKFVRSEEQQRLLDANKRDKDK